MWSAVAPCSVCHTSWCAQDLLDGVLAGTSVPDTTGVNVGSCHVHHGNTLPTNTIYL